MLAVFKSIYNIFPINSRNTAWAETELLIIKLKSVLDSVLDAQYYPDVQFGPSLRQTH